MSKCFKQLDGVLAAKGGWTVVCVCVCVWQGCGTRLAGSKPAGIGFESFAAKNSL